ncbi:hypothetical protein ILUMI_24659 [Ignelater luminosus]|uniref:Transposase Tc1-like domain-containing protein n=1 Tax=Ignelater luminosus TaxID=2038154 RepID=A0A8K0FYI9_IGNLU|nr:hypothetical protein ILUMI_24659 [Ignelater luminosus]
MKIKKELLSEIRSLVVTLSKKGESIQKIAKSLRIFKGAVQRTLERYRSTGKLKSKSRSGRLRKTTKIEDDAVIIVSKLNRRLTAPEITAHLNTRREDPVSVSTIKRQLRKAGLFGRMVVKNPLLRTENKHKRFIWTKQHHNWTRNQWKKYYGLMNENLKFSVQNVSCLCTAIGWREDIR